jgi:hypothetical protein
MAWNKRFSKVLASLVLAAFVPLSTGCWGSYNLTRDIYNWNENVSDNKWVEWLIHLPVLFISPFVIMIDAILFNSIEFWSGSNPINVGESRSFDGPNGELAHVTRTSDDVYDVVVTEPDGATHTVQLVRDGTIVNLLDAQGRTLAQRPL